MNTHFTRAPFANVRQESPIFAPLLVNLEIRLVAAGEVIAKFPGLVERADPKRNGVRKTLHLSSVALMSTRQFVRV